MRLSPLVIPVTRATTTSCARTAVATAIKLHVQRCRGHWGSRGSSPCTEKVVNLLAGAIFADLVAAGSSLARSRLFSCKQSPSRKLRQTRKVFRTTGFSGLSFTFHVYLFMSLDFILIRNMWLLSNRKKKLTLCFPLSKGQIPYAFTSMSP
jgi:hypothetical protein